MSFLVEKLLILIHFFYIVIIALVIYFFSRFLFGRKEIEGFTIGFTFADMWNGFLMIFYNFWYSIYNFWKDIILFWIDTIDYYFAKWLSFINNTTTDITTAGNKIFNKS